LLATQGEFVVRRSDRLHIMPAIPAGLTVGGEPFQSQVCRTPEDLFADGESWRTALETKGWRKA
jgi:hypothetical protein